MVIETDNLLIRMARKKCEVMQGIPYFHKITILYNTFQIDVLCINRLNRFILLFTLICFVFFFLNL